MKKFHQYVFGRKFTLITDHKPLTTILGPKRSLAAARLQRWALILAAHSYEIKFRPTGAHGNADGLSRLPLKSDGKLLRMHPLSSISNSWGTCQSPRRRCKQPPEQTLSLVRCSAVCVEAGHRSVRKSCNHTGPGGSS